MEAVLYKKNENNIISIYAKLFDDDGVMIRDELVKGNSKYGNVNLWKDFNLSYVLKNTEYANEIVHYYYIPLLFNFEHYCIINELRVISFEGDHPDFNFLKGYFCKKKILKEAKHIFLFRKIKYSVKLFLSLLTTIFFSCASWLYGFLRFFSSGIQRGSMKSEHSFALIHSKSSYNKIKSLDKELVYYYDSRNIFELSKDDCTFSFYEIINLIGYLKLLIQIVPLSIRSFLVFFKNSYKVFGLEGATISVIFFCRRFGHYHIIKSAYKQIFENNKNKTFYSGERESRYSSLAMNFANQNNSYGVGIPHGIAYSYNFPLGIFGHKYYCYNGYESEYLNEIYKENKFLFDKNLMLKIYSKNKLKSTDTKQVVFFTEPRRWHINLKILDSLSQNLNLVYIKLHPLDKKNRYSKYNNIEFIDDLSLAINSNICLARKSSILIEAIYCNSKSVAVLIDEQDSFDYLNTFPALSDNEIIKTHNLNDLLNKINLLKNEK